MLSVIKLADAEYPLGQVALGIEDYYLGIGEAPGVWAGRWATKLGLAGVVQAGDLRALVNAVDPRNGMWWLEGRPVRKVNAFDATFSAPKSASLLWAFSSPEVASVVSRAQVQAVAEALEFLEDKAAVSRQQSGGVRTRVATEGWAVATFVHRTSRAGDPQLHTHCIIPNVVCRREGSHASLDGAVLFTWAKAAGCVYQEQLRRILTAELGVAWGPDVNGCREMVGFAPGQLRAFSKRTSQIDDYLERSGGVYHTAMQRMRADREASLATRPAKDRELTPERLRDRWASEAAAVGLDAGVLAGAVLDRAAPAASLGFDEVVAALTDAESGLCANDSRFGEAHVVERVAALGAGRLTVAQIRGLAADFLASEHVVLLTADPDEAMRTPVQWTTAAHLGLERRVLDRLEWLIDRPVDGLDAQHVERAIRSGAIGLAGDQADAVRLLCGPGPALRSLIAPAGFGKTTAVHAAAVAGSSCGMAVLGVATTNQAVAELRNVGVPAITIARLALQIAEQPLDPGTVVILDEASQTATTDAEVVLAAVEAAGGRLWCLGDVRQAQAVRAGGLAAELDRLGHDCRIPAAVLVENRRQQHPAERAALAAYRAGDVTASQAIRTAAGLEHEQLTPQATRDAMADAVAADVLDHGAASVVALAVSHVDCEDLADRVRVRLSAAGRLRGPSLEGPGWGGEARRYQAGDRVLLHSRLGNGADRWHNGTVVTVTDVTAAGLSVATDRGERRVLPAEFVAGRQRDGRPNVSHGWCRTVDGAQGGTWDHVHLLGTAALDNFTGYVGQSRARIETHTWNVRRLPAGDWGGRLADDRSGAEHAGDAMRRAPLKTFAAHDNPFEVDRRLQCQIAAHRAVLAGGPPDTAEQLASARRNRAHAETMVAQARERLRYIEAQADAVGPLASLRRDTRSRRDRWLREVTQDRSRLAEAVGEAARWDAEVARLEPISDARVEWERREGWRVERVAAVEATLDGHWARAVLSATRQGDPLAFGGDRLRHAREHFANALHTLEASLPPDRTENLRLAEADLAHLQANHRHAVRRQAHAERQLREATVRQVGTRDKTAITLARAEVTFARGAVERMSAGIRTARTVVAIEQHAISERVAAETRTSEERLDLRRAIQSVNEALAATRPERVHATVDAPSRSRLGLMMGAPPRDPMGRAAWCGLAYRLETALDDTAAMSRLAWSKDPIDRLTRGLVDADPAAVARAQEIIAAFVGTATQPRIDLADPTAWEQATQDGMKAVRQPGRNHRFDVATGLGL